MLILLSVFINKANKNHYTIMFKIDFNTNLITDILVTLLLISFTLLSSYTWGFGVMMSIIAIIMLLNIRKHGFHFRNGTYLKYMLMLIVYTLMTSIWALEPTDTYEKAGTLISITLFIIVLYDTYYNANLNRLLYAIMWSGYLLLIYSFFYYGYSNLILIISLGDRLSSEFSNVNVIAMNVVISLIINIYYFFFKKKDLNILLALPAVILLIATASRKAIVMVIAGVLMMVLFKQYLRTKNYLFLLIKVIMIIALSLVIVLYLSQFEIFQSVTSRMEGLIASFTGEGVADHSSLERQEMRKLGLDIMNKYPLGIGIGCSHILSAKFIGHDAYLHNNYVEIAAGGGIIGLIVFYSIYLHFTKLRFYLRKEKLSIILSIIVVLMLLKDYGAVSYYYKENYVYFTLICLYLSQKKRKVNIDY